MGSMAAGQQDVFAERLRRIAQGGPNTSGTIYAGVDAPPVPPPPKPAERTGVPFLLDLLLAPVAAAIGIVAMIAGRVGAFHLHATDGLVPEHWLSLTRLTADIGIAAVLLLLLGWSFSFGGGLRRLALIGGFAATMLVEPQIVAMKPDLFAALTSEVFVAEALARL